jgi:cbb3-type cytochrome oxidase subunit 1
MLGGVLFLTGALLMIYNLWMTVNSPSTEAPRATSVVIGLPVGAVVAGE